LTHRSPLWKVLHNHYEAFKAGYEQIPVVSETALGEALRS